MSEAPSDSLIQPTASSNTFLELVHQYKQPEASKSMTPAPESSVPRTRSKSSATPRADSAFVQPEAGPSSQPLPSGPSIAGETQPAEAPVVKKKRGRKAMPDAAERRKVQNRKAQKTFREKKLDHLKRLSDEATEAESHARTAIGLLYVVTAENNHLARLAGIQREPVTVASLCANTPLEPVLSRYTREIEDAQAGRSSQDPDPGFVESSVRESEEDAETISERSDATASRMISLPRRRHSTISEPVMEAEERVERTYSAHTPASHPYPQMMPTSYRYEDSYPNTLSNPSSASSNHPPPPFSHHHRMQDSQSNVGMQNLSPHYPYPPYDPSQAYYDRIPSGVGMLYPPSASTHQQPLPPPPPLSPQIPQLPHQHQRHWTPSSYPGSQPQ